jgi:class 3 adenylate cyclase
LDLVDKDFPRKPRVLVVDDDWLNRDVLATYFTHMGAEVTSATDGLKALEAATVNPPDLIMMDMQMPHMDGIEACRFIKSHPATQFVPVVVVTAMESDDTRMRALAAGADDFITKPYSSSLLMTRARALLKIKHLTDQLNERTQLLRRVLNRYVAEEVADTILTDPERQLRLGGETREVTVLFADIRGFTPFTERHTAAEVVEALNLMFAALTRVVFKHQGTFDKYLGDAIMAFYGAPVMQRDHPLRAVQTALEMQLVFRDLLATEPTLAGLGLGVGLHSGEATLGNVGTEKVMDYTVIGDTVNVAKRLTEEAAAGEILMSEATYSLVADIIEAEALGQRPIRGRVEGIAVYGVRLEPQAMPNLSQ